MRLTTRFCLLACVLLALAAPAGAPFAPRAAAQSQQAPPGGQGRDETLVVSELNLARARHGLPPLQTDPVLRSAARAHSLDMLERGYFAHGGVGSRLLRSGATGRLFGENLAWAAGVAARRPRTFVELWLASTAHRRNLLQPAYTRVGVGIAVGPYQGWSSARIVTADFAAD